MEKEQLVKKEEHMPENKMGTMPIGKLLFQMSWPAILSMTISAMYNIVDSMFVSQVSEDSLTAVSIIFPLQMLIIAIGVGSGVGVNSLISRRLGAKRQKEADLAASTGIFIGIMNYVLFLLLGILVPRIFVGMYAAPGSYIYDAAISYLRIVFIGSIFVNIEIIIEKILQSTGNMLAPMICSLTGAIVNIVLDPILIFGLLGAPKLGVTGAAIATVIGQLASFIIGVCVLIKGEHLVNIQLKGFKVNWKIVGDIYKVGLPSIVMQSINSFMNVFYNMILVSFSTTAVAVLGIYYKLQSFVFLPVFGLTQGSMPIIGFNFGAGNKKRVMEGYKASLATAVVVMVIGVALFQLIPVQLLSIFDAKDQMIALGVPALRIISLSFIPAAFGITTGTVFQGTGHGVYSLICSVIRQLVGILPLAYIFAMMGGVTMSWYSFPAAEILGVTYCAVMFRQLYKKEISKLPN